MLTSVKLWNIIKQRFGVPYTFFELDAHEAIQYIRDYTIPMFSQYVPAKTYITMDSSNIVDTGQSSVFVMQYDGSIVTVVDVISDQSQVITGHPVSPVAPSDVTHMVTQIQDSNIRQKMSTTLNFTWEFLPPNQLKLFPPSIMLGATYFIVEAEVFHKDDFSTIPSRFEAWFIDLAVASIMEVLANIRQKYANGSYQTPFGTIDLSPDTLLSQSEQIKSRVLEKLETLPPNTVLVVS